MKMTAGLSISVRTNLGFEESLGLLRRKLKEHDLPVIAQVQFHREFEKTLGLRRPKYTVLVIWNPFYAYQTLLGSLEGGLFLPLNILVAEDGSSTLIASINHSLAGLSSAPIAIQVLVRELGRMVRQIFQEIVIRGTTENRTGLAGMRKEAL